MTNDFLIEVSNLIKLNEGFRSSIYIDNTGHQTIGYGHNLDASRINYKIPISIEDAEILLQQDITIVISWLSTYKWWNILTNTRKMCLIDLGFNIGENGFKKFVHMISALAISNYIEAANQMKMSVWFTQVGHRGWHDYLLMLKG